MIGKLKGTVNSFGPDSVILDVHGVGYLVHCSARTLEALPRPGEAAVLSIETHVREQEIKLFGFASDLEREWFRLLLLVQGVGAKVALSVLGTLRPGDLASAIALQDKAMIARSPGVGPKVAARICTELKDKAPALSGLDFERGAAAGRSRRQGRAAPRRGGGIRPGQSRLCPSAGFRRDRRGDAGGRRRRRDRPAHPPRTPGA